MRLAILAFVAGIALLQVRSRLPEPATMAALAVAGGALLFAARGALRSMGAGALFGFCWAALVAHAALSSELSLEDEGRDITLVGTVDSLPYRFGQGVRFNLAVEQVTGATAAVPARVALSWYGGPSQPAADVQPGERWRLAVRLQRPHGTANPHGFDYEAWLLQQGLRATGYVRSQRDVNVRLVPFVPTLRNAVERARARLRARISQALEGKPYAGVIVALVVGDQRAIEQSDWTIFNRTGIAHLVSISGLHVTMVAGLFAMAVSFLWRHSFFTRAQLPLLLPAQKVAALAGVSTAFIYVLLAGFGIPAQRTLYMLAVVAAAVWSGRSTSVSHMLAAALGVVALLDPWAVLAPGFWLSFGAVAAILYATAGRAALGQDRAVARLRQAVRVQYAVTLGLVPLSILLFAQVSLVGPVANAIAIPLISLVATPLALLGSVAPGPVSSIVLGWAHATVEWLAVVLAWLAASPYAVWTAPVPGPVVFASALVGFGWMLAPRGWPLRWLGAVLCLPLLAAAPSRPAPGEMVVTAFDAGQGTAVLVETHGHRLLYDTGPAYSPGSDAGGRVILPFLKGRGINRLDTVVVSHSDTDHVGGALSVLRSVDAPHLLSSLPPGHPARQAAPSHTRCEAGQRWEWDGVQFAVLHPRAESYGNPPRKANAMSCVIRVTDGQHAVLLAADIEAKEEAQLLASGVQLRSDVLMVPHHGSGTSSTPAFLDAVKPRIAVFQVGHRNRYRHPKREVFERYGEAGALRLRTDQEGAVTLRFGRDVEVGRFRQQRARYWHQGQGHSTGPAAARYNGGHDETSPAFRPR